MFKKIFLFLLEVMKELSQIVHSINSNDYMQHVHGIKQYFFMMLQLVVLGERQDN
jgi:hypothetical protein